MTFSEFIKLIYIRGYFEKGYLSKTEYKAQPFFVIKLLKGSVKNPKSISVSEAAINGYLKGDSIGVLVQELKKAEFDANLCSEYLKSLYDTNHKDTPTFRKRFNGKNYREALFEKVIIVIKDTSLDNMSMDLALLFNDIIDASFPEQIFHSNSRTQNVIEKGSLSTNTVKIDNENNDSLEAKMDILLTALITTGRELAEFKPTGVGDAVRQSKLIETLNNDFKLLLALSKQLPKNKNGDNSSIYSEIQVSVQSLTAENFILSTSEFMIESLKNYHIHRLIELLSQLNDITACSSKT